jgi:hypothetical protein
VGNAVTNSSPGRGKEIDAAGFLPPLPGLGWFGNQKPTTDVLAPFVRCSAAFEWPTSLSPPPASRWVRDPAQVESRVGQSTPILSLRHPNNYMRDGNQKNWSDLSGQSQEF